MDGRGLGVRVTGTFICPAPQDPYFPAAVADESLLVEYYWLLDGSPLAEDLVQTAVTYTAIFERMNDPRAETMRKKLVSWFDGKEPPMNINLVRSIYDGARWHMLNGDSDKALVWLTALNDVGYPWRFIEGDPLFDRVRQTPEFEAWWEQLETIASSYR